MVSNQGKSKWNLILIGKIQESEDCSLKWFEILLIESEISCDQQNHLAQVVFIFCVWQNEFILFYAVSSISME